MGTGLTVISSLSDQNRLPFSQGFRLRHKQRRKNPEIPAVGLSAEEVTEEGKYARRSR